MTDTLEIFKRRIAEEWLPAYCSKRRYTTDAFKFEPFLLSARDASDCMRAIDSGIVRDEGTGAYLAAIGTVHEYLFWELGRKIDVPRRIRLWLEPVIAFAALARLHFDYGWPPNLLGVQPKTWAFDLAAYGADRQYRILGEVKKTDKEAKSLISDLTRACAAQSSSAIPMNSAKKWNELVRGRPPTLWIIGPAGCSRVFRCSYPTDVAVNLLETSVSDLIFAAV
jgi:hypothetical protein